MPSWEEEMIARNVIGRAAVALLGAAVLGPALHRLAAVESEPAEVREAMLVSTSWIEQHLHDPSLVLLYVGRDREVFDAGHIVGTRFLRLDEIVEQHKDSLNELPPVADLQAVFESLGVGDDSHVVLMGDAGGVLAARAYFTLDYLGHGDRASLLNGGLEKWIAESRSTVRNDPHPKHAHFTPQLQPSILVSTAQMEKLSGSLARGEVKDYVLLDARPMIEFDGAVNSDAVPTAGHIAGSQSLYWRKLIDSESNSLLLEPDQLRQQFAMAGVPARKRVVTYCRTGMQSSFTYFVAKYLGYPAAMYDGSVYEWVHAAHNPLVVSPAGPPVSSTQR
jgi:thiosulfate/3-mercaptopyruvate sulfurtransferase